MKRLPSFCHYGLCLLCVLCLMACAGPSQPSPANQRSIAANTPGLRLSNGVCFLHDSVFTGTVVAHHPNGKVANTVAWVQGRQHGPAKSWFANGRKESLAFFVHGSKAGTYFGWWPNGQLKTNFHYVADTYEGQQREWYPNGKPYRFFTYHLGHEEGPQTVWNTDGTQLANYVAQNGGRLATWAPSIALGAPKAMCATLCAIAAVLLQACSAGGGGAAKQGATNSKVPPYYATPGLTPTFLPTGETAVPANAHTVGNATFTDAAGLPFELNALRGKFIWPTFSLRAARGCARKCATPCNAPCVRWIVPTCPSAW